jgi:hypothetical protein
MLLFKIIKQDCYVQKDVFANVIMQDCNEDYNTKLLYIEKIILQNYNVIFYAKP